MKIDEALIELTQTGLYGEICCGNNRIIGGAQVSNALGINVYTRPFAIYAAGSAWTVMVSSYRQPDFITSAKSLEKAVAIVCKIYALEG